MEKLFFEITTLLTAARVKKDEPMATHTAFRAGGKAGIYVEVDKTEELIAVVKHAYENQIPVKMLGSGTNMLVVDGGFPGVIIKNNCRRFEVLSRPAQLGQLSYSSQVVLYCEAGALLNQVVRYTIDEGLSGLEYQLGLPGTVGGGVYMNSQYPPLPAFVGDHVKSARILTESGEVKEVNQDYFQFRFDFSQLQKTQEILLSVVFELTPFEKHLLWGRGQEASHSRIAEQPRGVGNGMTFRNMEITAMDESSGRLGKPRVEDVLIESGALQITSGGVKLYEKRYNYILNMEYAKVSDVVNLATQIKNRVNDASGAQLHFEGHVVG
ncbi:UDP-N-acetylmuramate dehydrogenase [soil metagenome]